MKGWRWFLSLVCSAALLGLLGSGLAGLSGGEKDKDKDKAAAKDADKGKDKDKAATKDADKDKTAAKDADKDKAAGKDKGKEPEKVAEYVWKGFEKEFFQKLETTTKQTLVVMDQKIEQTQKQIFYVQWTPKGKDDKGNYKVEQKIQGMEMLIDIGGNKIAYNSEAKDTPKNPMSDFFSNLKDAVLTYSVSPSLEIIDIENRKELIAKLSASNPQMKTLLETLLSKEALTQMAQPTWGAFPPAKRDKNDWSKTVTLPLGNIGTYSSTLNYAIDKADPNKIDITSELKYEAPKDVKAGPRLPFTIKSADTKDMKAKGTGTATWDKDAGRFSKVTMTTSIENLKLTIEVGNVDTSVVINQTQTSEINTDGATFLGRKAK